MIIFEFSAYVYSLTLRMRVIKKLIEDLKVIPESSPAITERKCDDEVIGFHAYAGSKYSYVPIIDTIGKVHEKLCEAIDNINLYFSRRMLFLSLDIFLLIAFFAYYSVISILTYNPDLVKYVGANMFFLGPLAVNIFQISCFVLFCRSFYREVSIICLRYCRVLHQILIISSQKISLYIALATTWSYIDVDQ